LNYELDTYLDALQHFPDHVDVLQTAKGNAQLIKKDIFKNLMWYTLPDSSKQYPLTIDTVKKIKALNEKGIRPEELETAEISSTGSKAKEAEPQFVDVVGQISLRSLDRYAQKKRGQGNSQGRGNRQGPRNSQVGDAERAVRVKAPQIQTEASGDRGRVINKKDNADNASAPRIKPSIQIKKENEG